MAKQDTQLDNMMIALADPTRRAILEKLFDGPARVTELAEPFSMSLNSVSKHIRILERGRLVSREKRGRDHYLTLQPHTLEEVVMWVEDRRPRWKDAQKPVPAKEKAEKPAKPAKEAVSGAPNKGLDAFAALMAKEEKKPGWKLPWFK
jgi:DNA-binding transcriptional ArsR family regulator